MARTVERQRLVVKIDGMTWHGRAGGPEHGEEVVIDLELDRDAPNNRYRAQHADIENQVVDALNRVQAKMARERGDEGF
jgi:hypothetical protein